MTDDKLQTLIDTLVMVGDALILVTPTDTGLGFTVFDLSAIATELLERRTFEKWYFELADDFSFDAWDGMARLWRDTELIGTSITEFGAWKNAKEAGKL